MWMLAWRSAPSPVKLASRTWSALTSPPAHAGGQLEVVQQPHVLVEAGAEQRPLAVLEEPDLPSLRGPGAELQLFVRPVADGVLSKCEEVAAVSRPTAPSVSPSRSRGQDGLPATRPVSHGYPTEPKQNRPLPRFRRSEAGYECVRGGT